MPTPNVRRYAMRALLGLAGVGLPTYALLRGAPIAEEQYRRFRANERGRERDLSTPMPTMTVKESYEKFASEKISAEGAEPRRDLPFGEALGDSIRSNTLKGVGQGVGNAIGDVFIRTPVDELSKLLKKHLITGPKHQRALQQAIESDDVLGQTDRAKIDDAHGTLKRFSPSLAEDPNAVRSYLRTAVMSHGGVDLATIRMLLDAEKARQAGKGKFVLP